MDEGYELYMDIKVVRREIALEVVFHKLHVGQTPSECSDNTLAPVGNEIDKEKNKNSRCAPYMQCMIVIVRVKRERLCCVAKQVCENSKGS